MALNADEIAKLARATLGDTQPETEQSAEEPQQQAYQTSYTDADGTVYDWDFERQGWFPRVDEDFIAQYQLNYGIHKPNLATASTSSSAVSQNDSDSQQQKHDQEPSQAGQQQHLAPPPGPTAKTDDDVASTTSSASTLTEAGVGRKRKHQVQTEWFQLDDAHNANMYITGLPPTITQEELTAFMRQCGIIKEDGDGNLRLKIYRDEHGTPKGDALCSYLKVESVPLALDILDGQEIKPGYPIKLERAKFEQKGEFKARKKPKKKPKSAQEKLLSWAHKKDPGTQVSKKVAAIVVLKNMFSPNDFDEDPMGITEISEDVRAECSRCGSVKKVIVFDRHTEGVVSVRYDSVEGAEKCIKLMNNRWFGGRRITAEHWDGKTDYKIEETDHEREQRLENWEKYLQGTSAAAAANGSDKAPKSETDSAEVVEDLEATA